MSKKIDWISEPLATGSMVVSLFPLGKVLSHRRWEFARIVIREILEEHHCQVGSLRCWSAWVRFDPVFDRLLDGLWPSGYVLRVRRVGVHPPVRQLVMIIGPLRHKMRLALVPILLKPRLDVRRDKLTSLWFRSDT